MVGNLQNKALKDKKRIWYLKQKCVPGSLKDLKKEESARKLVQNDSGATKEEIRQIKLGSGSTACSEASTAVGNCASGTFARPPPGIAARFCDFFVPRKMEF